MGECAVSGQVRTHGELAAMAASLRLLGLDVDDPSRPLLLVYFAQMFAGRAPGRTSAPSFKTRRCETGHQSDMTILNLC